MAIGKASDFKVYPEQFFGGWTEIQQQFSEAFNGPSNGTIRLIPQMKKGDYEYESFMTAISSLVTRRDTTSVSAVTDLAMAQDEVISVKLARKIGPVANTLDSLRKIASDPEEFSFLLGQQWAKAVQEDMINSAIRAVVAAISGNASVITDKSGSSPSSATTEYLVNGLALFGDAGGRIRAWLMHSAQYYDLLEDQVTDALYRDDNTQILEGVPKTLGRPLIVTDDASLIISGSPTDYWMLGLAEDAVTIIESEDRYITSDEVTGLENLAVRVQGEYAYNVRVKGHKWDVGNGGANPTANAVATTSNWDQVATSNKDTPGVGIRVTT